MKIIDEKGRLFGKINIIDLCVILAVFVAVGVFFLRGDSASKIEKTSANTVYTVDVKAVREATVKALKNAEGQSVFLDKTGEMMGTITKVSGKTAEGYIISKDGEFVKTPYPDKFDVRVTISSNGYQNAKGVYTESGKQILIGEKITFVVSQVQTSGEITDLEVK